MKSFTVNTLLHKNLIGKIVLLLFCGFILTAFISTSAWSCEGKDYEETLELVHLSLEVGYNFAKTVDINLLRELNNKLYALPPSCQRLMEKITDGFQDRYNPSSTTCFDGVCCDSNGCTSS